jgi:hypothetical protein
MRKTFAHGATMQIEMADATAMSRLVMVANGTVTHSFNSGQRFVELRLHADLATASARRCRPRPATAPPGFYQVFALDAAGVPSKAVIVGLGQTGSTAPNATVPHAGGPAPCSSTAWRCPARRWRPDVNGLAVPKTLAAARASAADLASAQYIARDGLADANCLSFESVGSPGRWLRHAGYRLQSGHVRQQRAVQQRRHLLPGSRQQRRQREAAFEELPDLPAAPAHGAALDRPRRGRPLPSPADASFVAAPVQHGHAAAGDRR